LLAALLGRESKGSDCADVFLMRCSFLVILFPAYAWQRDQLRRHQSFSPNCGAASRAAFLTLAGIAAAGLLLFWLAMPETRDAGAAEANLQQTDKARLAEKTLMEAAPG